MALLLGGGLVVIVAVVTTQLRRRDAASNLGYMNEKWLAHQRSSPSP